MPGKRKNKKAGMSKKMVSAVREISRSETLRLAETKTVGRLSENNQLYHNVSKFIGPFLAGIKQGIGDPTLQQNANARIGDEILLKEFETKFWLSNKSDRPNVMIRITTFWYPNRNGAPPNPADVYYNGATTTNTMIAGINREVVSVISDKYVFSAENYANTPVAGAFPLFAVPGRERSSLRNIRKNWKMKRIKFLDTGTGTIGAGSLPKAKDIYVCITAYDAYGTLTTDNIASYALNYHMNFKDL